MALIYSDQVFVTAPPPPPLWPAVTSLSPSPVPRAFPTLEWKESEKKTLTKTLYHLQRLLQTVHKRKISWPTEESFPPNITPNEYLMLLLRPIPDIFNQSHSQRVLQRPMRCINLNFAICGATFSAEEFERWRLTPPIVLSLLHNIFLPSGQVSPQVNYALSLALEHAASATVIVTDYKDIAIFFPPRYNHLEPTFERVSTNQPSLTIRILATAYLVDVIPGKTFLNLPDIDIEIDEDNILPEGPPQDPQQPLLADEEVFATHHRNSDFDMATLIRDRARALQFFRWHEYVSKSFSKLVAHPDDILTAKTNEVGLIMPDTRPIYPFDHSELPSETAVHLQATHRESPLVTAGVSNLFEQSSSFTLEIEAVIAEGSKRGICTVYLCQLTSIDDVPVLGSPPLCLKLFDDRFQLLHSPDEAEEEFSDDRIPRWFDTVVIAEAHALNEAFAYDKLLPVQGSIIPWFYGTHQFTLPDGTILYGLLMEYVEGWKLNSDRTRELTPDRQIKMIQGCRHAARVLDVADVSQRDWHNEQVLLYTNPFTKIDHAVLIDFASTTQTWKLYEPNFIQNYIGMLHVLLSGADVVGLDRDLVWKHFGEPDNWDPVCAFIPVTRGSRESRTVQNQDLPFGNPEVS